MEEEHAVIVNFSIPISVRATKIDRRVNQLVKPLVDVEYDGFDTDTDERTMTLYFYGSDANRIFERVKVLLQSLKIPLEVTLRFGPAASNCEETKVRL